MSDFVRTTCPYCGVGCGVIARRGDDGRPAIAGDREHPANFGRLCSKGAALGETLGLDGRLLRPKIDGIVVDWDSALDTVANGFARAIRDHGPDSVAFYVSGQLLTEDYYVANKLMKGFIGSANIDTNSRLCMASSVAGHRRAFGFDTVPGCYEDLELADLVVLVGSNAAWCHPVLFQRLSKARDERGTRIVVVDPRRTATCEIADLHLPIRPGTDVLLFNGLLAHLASNGLADARFVAQSAVGYKDAVASASAEAGDVGVVAEGCGLDPGDVERFYALFAPTEKTVTVYSQGVNQSVQGTDKVNAIINCHLATGRIGRAGMGPFSVTGQPNAMGGREVGGLANQLAAHMGFDDHAAVDRVRRFWKAPAMAREEGLKAMDLFRAVDERRIKAIWIMATNPAVSLPDADTVRRGLASCDFVVVSDCVADTDTARLAHVLLPATTWGEKDGTVTNSERRISRQRAFVDPPGEARHDWWTITEVARRMGFARGFSYRKPAEIFREHAALSAFRNGGSRPFDISGLADIDDDTYERLEPIQWPVKHAAGDGTKRLYENGVFPTPDRKARMVAVRWQGKAGVPFDGPLILNTGRIRDQWHTMTRTGTTSRLTRHEPEPFVEIHPDDAGRFGIDAQGLVRVNGHTGSVVARARVSADQQRGSVFVPMHWSDRFTGDCVLGRLVRAVTDPISGQPDSKATPVAISAVPVTWRGFLIARRTLRPKGVAYWARFAGRDCQIYELAGSALPDGIDAWACELLGSEDPLQVMRYQDVNQGVWRWALLSGGRLEACLFVTCGNNLPAREWLESLFAAADIDTTMRRVLLSGTPPAGATQEGQIICSCFGVGIERLIGAIRDRRLSTVEAIGEALQAGTNCGSCIPELKHLLADTRQTDAA